jgi:hypothetical protein
MLSRELIIAAKYAINRAMRGELVKKVVKVTKHDQEIQI